MRKKHLLVLALALILLVGCSSDLAQVRIEMDAASVDVGDEVKLSLVGRTAVGVLTEITETPVWEAVGGTITPGDDNQAVFVPSEEGRVTVRVTVGEFTDEISFNVGEKIIAVRSLDFIAQGGGSVQVQTDRTYPCFSHWNDLGHWLEWEFDVPKSGVYVPVMMYSTGARYDVFRSVSVDGELVIESVEFPNTGGFGRNPEEWRSIKLEPIYLEAGKRILHIENIVPDVETGLNPAWIALVHPVELADSPDIVARVDSLLGL
ncbi:MAG: hypothetical protein ACE3NC_10360 [Candidatus Wallacebacter cryptica]|nr:hypothetical protein [Bacillota bacterium]